MADDKEALAFWVRNDINGEVAGPFTSTQMSEYLKTLPKAQFGYYKVKSSKWNEWKPLVSVIKEKTPSAAGAAPPPTPVPPPLPAKKGPSVAPLATPAKPKTASKEDSGLWTTDQNSKSDSNSTFNAVPPKELPVPEASEDDAFSDALASAESLSFESSINIEKAKILNNRQYPRFEVDVEITFIGAGGENFVTKTRDLSLGGMQFVDPVPMNLFEESALVSLFYRAARQRFTANLMPVGEVNGHATRAFFNYLSPKNLELLHEWLRMGDAKQITDGRIAALKKKRG